MEGIDKFYVIFYDDSILGFLISLRINLFFVLRVTSMLAMHAEKHKQLQIGRNFGF